MPKLTPLDIRKQEFPQRFRGYDPDEVDTFLDLIAADTETLLNERAGLQDRTATLETQLAEFKEIEKSLRDALVMAEKMSSEAHDNAQRRIDAMLREAEVKSISIIAEAEARGRDILSAAENRRRALLLQIEALESQLSYALSRFRSLLDDQRNVLEAHTRPMADLNSETAPGPVTPVTSAVSGASSGPMSPAQPGAVFASSPTGG